MQQEKWVLNMSMFLVNVKFSPGVGNNPSNPHIESLEFALEIMIRVYVFNRNNEANNY